MFARTTRVPNTDRTTIRQILTIRIAELFPIALGEAAFDFILTDDVSEAGKLAVVFAMNSTDIRSLRSQITSASVKILGIVPEAAGAVIIAKEAGIKDAALVGCADEGMTVDIISNGSLVLSRTTIGGAAVLSEVRRSFAAAGLSTTQVIGIGGYSFEHSDRVIAANEIEAIAKANDLPKLELPDEVAKQQHDIENGKIRQAVLVLVAAVVALGYVANDYAEATVAVQAKAAKNAKSMSRLTALTGTLETRAQKSARRRQAVDLAFLPAQRLSDVARLVANRAPAGIWLTGVNAERGKPLLVRGTAKTSDQVSEYLQNLNREARLRDVKLVFANNATIDKAPVVQFSVSAVAVGNLPVIEFGKGKK
jgi:Tfp pilus assembly protein PilN